MFQARRYPYGESILRSHRHAAWLRGSVDGAAREPRGPTDSTHSGNTLADRKTIGSSGGQTHETTAAGYIAAAHQRQSLGAVPYRSVAQRRAAPTLTTDAQAYSRILLNASVSAARLIENHKTNTKLVDEVTVWYPKRCYSAPLCRPCLPADSISPQANNLFAVAWNGQRFAAVGENGTILVSP